VFTGACRPTHYPLRWLDDTAVFAATVDRHPRTWPVNTGVRNYTRVYGPCLRAVNVTELQSEELTGGGHDGRRPALADDSDARHDDS